MMFISGIIIQKNRYVKIRVIYFCPNCVKFLPENAHFFYFFFCGGGGGGGQLPPLPSSHPEIRGNSTLYPLSKKKWFTKFVGQVFVNCCSDTMYIQELHSLS